MRRMMVDSGQLLNHHHFDLAPSTRHPDPLVTERVVRSGVTQVVIQPSFGKPASRRRLYRLGR